MRILYTLTWDNSVKKINKIAHERIFFWFNKIKDKVFKQTIPLIK